MARPRTIAIAAVTVDGKIARNDHELVRWTSKEDKEVFHRVTKDIGVIVVGKRTYETFPAPLPGRLHIVMTRNTGGQKNVPDVEFTSSTPEKILEDLGSRGFKSVAISGGATIYSMFIKAKLLDELLVTFEPKIFGHGISLFSDSHECDLELVSHELINKNSILCKYKLIYT